MAEEKIKIAEIDIGVDKLVAKAGEVKKRLEELKQSNRDLKKDTDNLSNATAEQMEQYTLAEVEVKNLSKEYRNHQKVLDAYINIQNQDIKTKEQARDANLKLMAIVKELDTTNVDHQETIKKINKEIDDNTDFIKKNSSEYEKTKINIGNYKEAITGALSELGIFGQYQKEAQDIMTAFGPVFDSMKQDFKEAMSLFGSAAQSTKEHSNSQKENIETSAELVKAKSTEIAVIEVSDEATQSSTESTKALTVVQKAQAIATNSGAAALKLFRVALIATGIGAFVVIFGSLVSYLTSTQEGIDKVNRYLAPMKEIFQALLGVVQNFGKSLFDAMSNPKELIKDIGEAIKQNLINRFTALGKIVDAFLAGDWYGVGDGILQAGTGVENLSGKVAKLGDQTSEFFDEAAKRGRTMADLQVQIEKGEIRLITLQSEYQKQIKEANKIAEDQSRNQKEREEAAKRSIALSQELVTAQNNQLDNEIKLAKMKTEANDTSREEEKAIAELIAKRNQNETAALELQTTQQTKLNSIRQQVESKNKEAAAKAYELEIKRNQATLKMFELEQGYAAKSGSEKIDIAEKVFQKQLEIERKKLAAGKITQEELNAFILENQTEMARMQAEVAVSNAEYELQAFKLNHQKKIEANKFLSEELFNQEQERLNKLLEAEKAFQQEKFSQGLITQQDYNAAIAQLNDQSDKDQQALKEERKAAIKEKEAADYLLEKELNQERLAYDLEYRLEQYELEYQRRKEIAQKAGADMVAFEAAEAKERKAIEQSVQDNKLDLASQTYGNLATILGKESAAGKAIAVAQATMDTYKAANAAYSAMAGIPVVGPALGIVAAGAAIASGVKNIKEITKTKTPRAEKGIMLDINGKSHSQGGETFYDQYGNPIVEAQGGEKMVILKREASRELDVLSRLNQKHGGVSLSTPVTYANNGGAVIRNPSVISTKGYEMDYKLMSELMSTAVADKVNSIQQVIAVDQINNVSGKMARAEIGSEH